MSNHVFDTDLHQELGLMSSYRWHEEPVRVLFVLSRYKFVAQMLKGYNKVLEVGCGDGLGSALVASNVGKLIGIDQDPMMIESAKRCQPGIEFRCTLDLEYVDAIYAIDVIEHIPYIQSLNWLAMLAHHAPVVIIGTPSIESQKYASQLSRENHINCMTGPQLKALMLENFAHVFSFSMNDEVVHTGFSPMSHYNFAIGIGARDIVYDKDAPI